MSSRMLTAIAIAWLVIATDCLAARLNPAAARAFQIYAANVEARLARQHTSPDAYLVVLNLEPDKRAEAERQLLSGEIQVEPVNGGTWSVSGGLLHHWRAAVFVRDAAPADMLALLRDCNHFSTYYAPEVISCHVLADRKESTTIEMRFKEQGAVTVVFDAEYDVRTALINDSRGYSISRSTHIRQIDDPGTVHEQWRPEGWDDGFLWHLNSYWSFIETRNGLLAECEAISLTRDVPVGLGWLITPIIADLPRQRLKFTLTATKNALVEKVTKEAHR